MVKIRRQHRSQASRGMVTKKNKGRKKQRKGVRGNGKEKTGMRLIQIVKEKIMLSGGIPDPRPQRRRLRAPAIGRKIVLGKVKLVPVGTRGR